MSRHSFRVRVGPFAADVTTNISAVGEHLNLLYPSHGLQEEREFWDFHVEIVRPLNLRRWWRPQAVFRLDRFEPFRPLPLAQAPAMFEWAMNASIVGRAHNYTMLHSASVERDGKAAILPGLPGAGKSTLTAALIWRGWRLLTDELTLIWPEDGRIAALARPVNLKGKSIDIIRQFAPEAIFGTEMPDTVKGRIALMRPPEASLARVGEPATPRWIIFPRWQVDATPHFRPMSKSMAFLEIARNAMNYSIQGKMGFHTTAALMDLCDAYQFVYGRLDDAIGAFDQLWSGG